MYCVSTASIEKSSLVKTLQTTSFLGDHGYIEKIPGQFLIIARKSTSIN